jgi:hypothetical protein
MIEAKHSFNHVLLHYHTDPDVNIILGLKPSSLEWFWGAQPHWLFEVHQDWLSEDCITLSDDYDDKNFTPSLTMWKF